MSRRPDGLLTVGQVARSAGLEAHVVRFYVQKGLLRPARIAANSYRLFSPQDVKRVRFIRVAQGLGFSLAEIEHIFRKSRSGQKPCPMVRDTIKRRLAENRERLDYLRALQQRMQHASELWKGMADQAPTGDHICALIEAVGEDGLPISKRPLRRHGLKGVGWP